MIEKQLDYFAIDDAFGGSQAWFRNIVMNIGGCAAATACDSCIYFGRTFGRPNLYPYDLWNLTKEDYIRFSQKMKPYIRPRVRGVHKLEWYMEGMNQYLDDVNEKIEMEGFSGNYTYEEAESLIRQQIDRGYPIPYLLLNHQDKETFKDFIWHWFLTVGYREQDGRFFITVATYGQATWFPLKELWDTGHEEKGGLIYYKNL
ncbi:MAG: hypothetical protein ACRC3H_22730 [Lachnospiraceae bacterium]